MPRRGESIWKRKDGRWEARYISSRDKDGKAHYSSVYASSYQEVKLKRATAIAMLNQPVEKAHQDKAGVSFAFAACQYLASRKGEIKESSLSRYGDLLTWYVYPQFGETSVADITLYEIEKLSADLISHGGKSGTGLSAKTVKDTMATIKQVIEYAVKIGFRSADSIPVEYPRQNNPPIIILSPSDQRKLRSYVLEHQSPVTIGILLALYTGIRIGEVCGLMLCDFHLDDGFLTVSRTVLRIRDTDDTSSAKTKVIISSPKSSSGNRNIPLHSELVPLLKKQIQINEHPDDTYFLTGTVNPSEPRSYYSKYKRILKKIGIQQYTFHALRHTFATQCIEIGIDPKTLSEILGHSNVQLTLDRYVHPSLDAKRKAIERLSFK